MSRIWSNSRSCTIALWLLVQLAGLIWPFCASALVLLRLLAQFFIVIRSFWRSSLVLLRHKGLGGDGLGVSLYYSAARGRSMPRRESSKEIDR